MTVREVTTAMSNVKMFYLVWDGNCNAYDPDNRLFSDAMGDYLVRRIVLEQDDPAQVELEIECHPVKAERDTLCGAAGGRSAGGREEV